MNKRDPIPEAIRLAYRGCIREHSGPGFKRPAWTDDPAIYSAGWYWENLDLDRFYFPTFEDAAHDLARDLGMTEAEAFQILNRGE